MTLLCLVKTSAQNTIMMLPDLPKKKIRLEAKKTPSIGEWLLKNWENDFVAEIKKRGDKLKPHQQTALNKVVNGNFIYKIPDMGRRNPFDLICLKSKKIDVLIIFFEGNKIDILRLNDSKMFNDIAI